MIYSAFYQQYHIDLAAAKMHWWQFKVLFSGLNEDTQFIKVIGYRNTDLSEIKNTEMNGAFRYANWGVSMKTVESNEPNICTEKSEITMLYENIDLLTRQMLPIFLEIMDLREVCTL